MVYYKSMETTYQPAPLAQASQSPVDETLQFGHNQPSSPVEVAPPAPAEPTVPSASKEKPSMSKLPLILGALVILAGVATGYGAAKLNAKGGSLGGTTTAPIAQVAEGEVKVGDVFGVQDEKTFKDSAEGYLQIGGFEGEGSHRLLRAGGESQTVYLTSSITDLDKFDGMQVKVAGETFKGEKAGWLMDVGRVQILETQAQPPGGE